MASENCDIIQTEDDKVAYFPKLLKGISSNTPDHSKMAGSNTQNHHEIDASQGIKLLLRPLKEVSIISISMIGEAFQLTHKDLNEIFAGKNTTLSFSQIEEACKSMPYEQYLRLKSQKECMEYAPVNFMRKSDESRLNRLINDGSFEKDNNGNKLTPTEERALWIPLHKLVEHKEEYMKENITLEQYIVELAKVEQLMTPPAAKAPAAGHAEIKEPELDEIHDERPISEEERKKAQRIAINKRYYEKTKKKAKANQKTKYTASKKEMRVCCCGCNLIVSNKQSYKKHLKNQIHQLFKQKLYALYSLRLMNNWTIKRAIKYMNHQEAICHYQRTQSILNKYANKMNTLKLRKKVDMMEIDTIEHRRVMLRGVCQDVLKRGEYLNNHSK